MAKELDFSELGSQIMKPRKEQVKPPQDLPKDFLKNIANLFNKQFEKERKNANFALYGALYPNEALVCISLMEIGRLRAISCYLSADIDKNVTEKPEQVTEILKSMVDLAASWFGQTFTEHKDKGLEAPLAALEDVGPGWQRVDWEKRHFFVQLTAENQVLEAAADRFLLEES